MVTVPRTAAVRPVVLVAPAAEPSRTVPALQLLGGSRLVDRLLDTLAEVVPVPPLVVAPTDAAATLQGTLPGAAAVIAVDGPRPAQLAAALGASTEETLLVHDAERALTPAAVTAQVLEALTPGVDAVVPAVAMTDSVKLVHAQGLRNIDRSTLAGLQSPRLLRRPALEAALASMTEDGPRDEVLALLALEREVRTVHGSHDGFAVRDRLTLWQAQIALGLARDTSGRQGLARRA